MCENKGYSHSQCLSVGCCHWNNGCWSSVGQNECIRDNGEAMCENKGYDPAQCAAVGCCHWNHVWKCRSSVGTNKCRKKDETVEEENLDLNDEMTKEKTNELNHENIENKDQIPDEEKFADSDIQLSNVDDAFEEELNFA